MAAELARRAQAWLRERGVISGDAFRELSVGEYANWPFPFAEEERAEVITKSLAQQLLGGDDAGWQACGRVMSAAWMERHAARVASWRAEGAVGDFPSLKDHLVRRRASTGMIPNMDFLEYEIGWELPDEVMADEDMKAIETTAAECVAIGGDLFRFTNDREDRRANFVICAMQEFGENEADAFKWVNHMHSRTVQELRQLEAMVMKRYPKHPMLTAWFDALHCAIYGFAQWHSRAPRYRATHEASGWTVQITITPACPDPF